MRIKLYKNNNNTSTRKKQTRKKVGIIFQNFTIKIIINQDKVGSFKKLDCLKSLSSLHLKRKVEVTTELTCVAGSLSAPLT